MHAGKAEKSPSLKACLTLLRARGSQGVTTWEFIEAAHVANPATEISALRHNGYTIKCQYESVNENGRKIYRYTLLDSPVVEGQLFAEGM